MGLTEANFKHSNIWTQFSTEMYSGLGANGAMTTADWVLCLLVAEDNGGSSPLEPLVLVTASILLPFLNNSSKYSELAAWGSPLIAYSRSHNE